MWFPLAATAARRHQHMSTMPAMSMPERTKAGMRGVEPEPGRGVKGRVCWGAAGIVVLGVGDWVGEEDGEAEVVREVEVGLVQIGRAHV